MPGAVGVVLTVRGRARGLSRRRTAVSRANCWRRIFRRWGDRGHRIDPKRARRIDQRSCCVGDDLLGQHGRVSEHGVKLQIAAAAAGARERIMVLHDGPSMAPPAECCLPVFDRRIGRSRRGAYPSPSQGHDYENHFNGVVVMVTEERQHLGMSQRVLQLSRRPFQCWEGREIPSPAVPHSLSARSSLEPLDNAAQTPAIIERLTPCMLPPSMGKKSPSTIGSVR